MKYKISLALFFAVISLSLIMPKTAAAFWWFNQKKTVATTTIDTGLDDQAKINIAAKYKIWESAFEKKDIESVIANQNNFSFTIPEINYLFETEVKNVKNPTLTGASVTSSDGNINVAANFHKFINGNFSFIAKIVSVENKIRMQLSYVKFFGFSIPTSWLEDPINKELDKYFAFLYNDARYQGFTFTADNNLLKIKPNFQK